MTRPTTLLAAMAAGMAFSGAAVQADVKLPAPYVSEALDAVILPVNDDVRASFGLDYSDAGFLVLAVSPGGVAEEAGIVPGDVIRLPRAAKVTEPRELDAVVWYWITTGALSVGYEVWRAGTWVDYSWEYTEESYWSGIDIQSVGTWTSWSYAEWSYSEYVTSYSEEITASYTEAETVITEEVTSEEFAAEYAEVATDEAVAGDEVTDPATTDDPAADDAGTDDPGSDDAGSDDAGGGDPGMDDAGGDDGGGDAGGDDGGGDAVVDE